MLDFASSLYLGFGHPSASLAPWRRLSLGKPAALQEFDEAVTVAQDLSALAGCEAGLLLPSTFHLFWDLLGVLSRAEPIEIVMDAGTYPIARWAAEHWAGRGVPLTVFARHDAAALARVLGRRRRRRAVVLADAVAPASRSQTPLSDYARLAQAHGAWLLLDDTQGLGLYGAGPCACAPYGRGGGGSLRRHRLQGGPVVLGSSLAKAFGVPVASLAGPRQVLRRFERDSAVRVHMSPPSMAEVRAAHHALTLNRSQGERLRRLLGERVRQLRGRLAAIGVATQGDDFPVQRLDLPPRMDAAGVYGHLSGLGVRGVLQALPGGTARISLIVTATHSAAEVDAAVQALQQAMDRAANRAGCMPLRRHRTLSPSPASAS